MTYLKTVRAKVVLFGIKSKHMKCRFELTYLKTITAKVVMFGIKLKVMKCRFHVTYFYDILTYLMTIRDKLVMFGIKPKIMKCRAPAGRSPWRRKLSRTWRDITLAESPQ
jgi:hypothetical protein